MRNLSLHGVRVTVTLVALALLPARAQQPPPANFQNPAVVQSTIEQITQRPPRQPESTKFFYGGGVSHIDGFIPFFHGMVTNWDEPKAHNKFTYADGRLTRCESFDDAGKSTGYQSVWYNDSGAPVLTGYYSWEGGWDWYEYAEYESSGKIHVLYLFNNPLELVFYDVFSYDGDRTSIKDYSRDSKLDYETLYENGGVFMIRDGEKKKVNTGRRADEIRAPEKLGLKPIYPVF